MPYPKRLIEVDLPIARISAHARREKSIRHGHISTLHIWWARRPLAACRAVICAALWPDPADEHCPPAFRVAAVNAIKAFAKRVFPDKLNEEGYELQEHVSKENWGRWEAIAAGTLTLDADQPADMPILRMALLDFIADFANWDNSTVPAYLETARALTQSAHEALGGQPGTRPLVVDPFAGGGSIPLEALRVGADAFASDLNPVAVLINKVVLEYIPRYGKSEITMRDADDRTVTFRGLSDAVRYWGKWVNDKVKDELAEVYPKDADGSTPIAYLWARTIKCEGPQCGVRIPLVGSLWLGKKPQRPFALQVEANRTAGVRFKVYSPAKTSDVATGLLKRGSANCPVCGFTTPVASVARQLSEQNGGANSSTLFCVVTTRDGQRGRFYREPDERDIKVAQLAVDKLKSKFNSATGLFPPNEPLPPQGTLGFRIQRYGMRSWGDLFTARQSLALLSLSRVEKASGEAATLREYLEHVWAVVSTEALSMIFRDADAVFIHESAFVRGISYGDFEEGDEVSFELQERGGKYSGWKVAGVDYREPPRTTRLKDFNENATQSVVERIRKRLYFPVIHVWRDGRSINDAGCPSDFKDDMRPNIKYLASLLQHEGMPTLVQRKVVFLLACMHKDMPDECVRWITEQVENGSIHDPQAVAFALGDVSEPWQEYALSQLTAHPTNDSLRVFAYAIWREQHFVEKFTLAELKSILNGLNALLGQLKPCPPLKSEKDKWTVHRWVRATTEPLELLLGLLRTRGSSDPEIKMLLQPHQEITKELAKQVERVTEIVGQSNVTLFSRVQINFQKPQGERTPDLLYALRLYLTGDDGANAIHISSVSDNDND